MSIPVNYYLARRLRYLWAFDLVARSARAVIGRHFAGEDTPGLLAEARREFDALIPQLPYIGGQTPFTEFVVFTGMLLAVHRVSQAHGKTVAQTGMLVHEIGRAFIGSSPTLLRRLLTRMNFSALYISRLRKRAAESYARRYPQGYVFDFVEGDGENFDYGVDYLECASCKFLAQQGAAELARYLCPVDVIYSRAWGWGLVRTMTLAEGAAKCDFRFKKGGPTRVAVPASLAPLVEQDD